jgi:hypothetical protein
MKRMHRSISFAIVVSLSLGSGAMACDLKLEDLDRLLAERIAKTRAMEASLDQIDWRLAENAETVQAAFSQGQECPARTRETFASLQSELTQTEFGFMPEGGMENERERDTVFDCVADISRRLEAATEQAVAAGNVLRVDQLNAIGSRLLRLDGAYTNALADALAAALRGNRLSEAAAQYNRLCSDDLF